MNKVLNTIDEFKEYANGMYVDEYIDTLYDFTSARGYETLGLYETGKTGTSLTIFCNKSKSGFAFDVKFYNSDDSKPCYIIPMGRLDYGVRLNLDWTNTDDFIDSIYQAIGRFYDSVTA